MNNYIGTKEVKAEPLCKDGQDGYKVVYKDGYTSWSPKDVFEEAYKTNGNLTFGDAIYYLKQGKKVARTGWNGKNMWLVFQDTTKTPVLTKESVYGKPLGQDFVTIGAHILMFTVQKEFVPWLASQTDVLAEDWGIVE